MGIDASMLEFILLSFFLIPLRNKFDYNWTDLIIGSVAGILICSGRICISIGVSKGLAGPAQSLMSTHALHQTFWSAVVAGQALNFLQILGVCFGLCGVFSISYLDHLAKQHTLKKKLSKSKSVEDQEAQLPTTTEQGLTQDDAKKEPKEVEPERKTTEMAV